MYKNMIKFFNATKFVSCTFFNATKIHQKCTFKLYQLFKEQKQMLCSFLCAGYLLPVAIKKDYQRARCASTLKLIKERPPNLAYFCARTSRRRWFERFKRVRATFAAFMPL